MGYILSVIFAIIAILSYLNERRWYNPLTITMSLWTLISFLAALQLFGIIDASTQTWLLILIGFMFLCIGYGLSSIVEIKTPRIARNSINIRVLYILIVLSGLYTLITIRDIWPYLRRNGLAITRMLYYDELDYSRTLSRSISSFINNYIFSPAMLSLRPIMVYMMLFRHSNKKDIVVILLIGLLCIGEVLFTGGRMSLLYLILQVCIGMSIWLINRKKVENVNYRNIKRTRRRTFFFVLLIFTGIIVASLSRLATSFMEMIYKYLCLCIPHLSVRLDSLGSSYRYTMGIAGLYGFINPIVFVLAQLGFGYPALYTYTINELSRLQTSVSVGADIGMNAFVTPVYKLYLDFGIVGVILGMTLLGALFSLAFRYNKKQNNMKSFVILLFIETATIRTIMTYPLGDVSFVIGFLYLLILVR